MPLAREQDRQRGAAGGVDLIAEAEADRAAVAARFERPADEQPIALDRVGQAERRGRLRAELGRSAAHAMPPAVRGRLTRPSSSNCGVATPVNRGSSSLIPTTPVATGAKRAEAQRGGKGGSSTF